MAGANAQPTLHTANRNKSTYSGGLRPPMSDTGAHTAADRFPARQKSIGLACTAPIGASRPCPIKGNAGRYVSMANGPIADSRPSASAFEEGRILDIAVQTALIARS